MPSLPTPLCLALRDGLAVVPFEVCGLVIRSHVSFVFVSKLDGPFGPYLCLEKDARDGLHRATTLSPRVAYTTTLPCTTSSGGICAYQVVWHRDPSSRQRICYKPYLVVSAIEQSAQSIVP